MAQRMADKAAVGKAPDKGVARLEPGKVGAGRAQARRVVGTQVVGEVVGKQAVEEAVRSEPVEVALRNPRRTASRLCLGGRRMSKRLRQPERVSRRVGLELGQQEPLHADRTHNYRRKLRRLGLVYYSLGMSLGSLEYPPCFYIDSVNFLVA
jgi:hypothetical protein